MRRHREVSIPEVATVDHLSDLAEAYEARHGRPPVELSYWDPSDGFVRRLAGRLRFPALGDPVRYRYSYESDVRDAVLSKLGYDASARRILLTENGTNAVLAVANALALAGVAKVRLLSPRYFATSYALGQLGMEMHELHWQRIGGSFTLPPIELEAGEALWVESPIFSTGISSDAEVSPVLRRAAQEGHFVVCDRSLAPLPAAFDPALEREERYFAIHAPHKTVCVNGLKFGAVTFHARWYDAFDHWQDVLSGGLSISAEVATRHFVSPEFDDYSQAVALFAQEASAQIANDVSSFGGSFEMDGDASGYWRTIYAPHVDPALGKDRRWLADLVERTGAVAIPGSLMGCDPAWGFCFRLNLLRYDPQFRGALRRLLSVLTELR